MQGEESSTFFRSSIEGGGEGGGMPNGGDSGDGSFSSRIIPAAMTGKSQLAAAFTALDESDQYDAVLTGLCAKILDDNSATTAERGTTLDDPIALLTEMNQRKISVSPRSLMALIDVSFFLRPDTFLLVLLLLKS